jgi:hypothetical protein
MTHDPGVHPRHHTGWIGAALLAVLLTLIAALVWSGWRSGVLAVRPGDLSMRVPTTPVLPRRDTTPNPNPPPLPKPGPGVTNG